MTNKYRIYKFTSYSIKVQAVNNVGIGNSSDPVLAKIQTTQADDKSPNAGLTAGAVIGAILFVILLFFALFILRRKFLKRQRSESVREFEIWHSKNRMEEPKGQVAKSQPNATAQTGRLNLI
ncbi:hypothetical protein CVT25_011823 [Paramuricea clavata]|uniref:Uncharacterized protein n=1 Tax=Paramuricea clavata TaxID=317549 RepID=A0A6S7H1X8_PARCT|nr:hypothetical protein CVT25_011823 [Paramuricea clavata]